MAQDDDDRPAQSEEFLISRTSLDVIHDALLRATNKAVNRDPFYKAIEELKTAQGNLGDHYDAN